MPRGRKPKNVTVSLPKTAAATIAEALEPKAEQGQTSIGSDIGALGRKLGAFDDELHALVRRFFGPEV